MAYAEPWVQIVERPLILITNNLGPDVETCLQTRHLKSLVYCKVAAGLTL